MREFGFSITDQEPAPPGLAFASALRFGYRSHSVRSTSLAAPRQLLQLVLEARGDFTPADSIWEKNGRYFDAMRPSVEPNGLAKPETVASHRAWHLRQVNRLLETSDVLLIALEATEAWEHAPSGTVYPVAPGTIAGSLDAASHRWRGFTFLELYDDLVRLFALCKAANPAMRFVIAVSPAPSTGAPGSALSEGGDSLLRAVAGQLYRERDDVEFAPLDAPAARGQAGAEAHMEIFGAPISVQNGSAVLSTAQSPDMDDEELERMLAGDDLCEEILNETFKP